MTSILSLAIKEIRKINLINGQTIYLAIFGIRKTSHKIMTYCLGIKVKDGLVAIADTRITSGTDTTSKKKIYIEQKDKYSLFIMTSGLRSVRDKAILYFKELIGQEEHNKLYKAVNAFGQQVKRVAEEDKSSLEKACALHHLSIDRQ